MSSKPVLKLLLITSILWIAWLGMMLVHEAGHVLGGVVSGGTIRQVVWHPAVLSRTDVLPNPHPLIELWSGPISGCIVPLLVAAILQAIRAQTAYLFWVIAGFCLIANGAYLGIGALDPVGDARELVSHGSPRWLLALFGICAAAGGLWIWHRISPHLGFGATPAPVSPRHVWTCFAEAPATLDFAWKTAAANRIAAEDGTPYLVPSRLRAFVSEAELPSDHPHANAVPCSFPPTH